MISLCAVLLIYTNLYKFTDKNIVLIIWLVLLKRKVMKSPVYENTTSEKECEGLIRPVMDALDILSGRWKLPIITSLYHGPKRYREILSDVKGITDKMLSKDLKELEMNKLIRRRVISSFPPAVEYSMTEHGRSLDRVIMELWEWGKKHRAEIIQKE